MSVKAMDDCSSLPHLCHGQLQKRYHSLSVHLVLDGPLQNIITKVHKHAISPKSLHENSIDALPDVIGVAMSRLNRHSKKKVWASVCDACVTLRFAMVV